MLVNFVHVTVATVVSDRNNMSVIADDISSNPGNAFIHFI